MKPRLGEEPVLRGRSEIAASRLGRWTEIGEDNVLENAEIGDYSYSGPRCIFQNCVVGKFSNIAASVRIGPTAHPIERASLHHFTYRSAMYGMAEDDGEFFARREGRIARVGHDTWIGHGAVVMPGVAIGDGAVIGSLSVVTRDIPPYEVAVGAPARPIRRRFPPEIARALSRIAWWDWDHEKLGANLALFRGPVEEFVRAHDPEASI